MNKILIFVGVVVISSYIIQTIAPGLLKTPKTEKDIAEEVIATANTFKDNINVVEKAANELIKCKFDLENNKSKSKCSNMDKVKTLVTQASSIITNKDFMKRLASAEFDLAAKYEVNKKSLDKSLTYVIERLEAKNP